MSLTFKQFSTINRARCESPTGFNHKLDSWSTSDWITAIVGELGEAANVVKKLNRVRDGIPGNKVSADELRAQLRRELGDVYVYLDLACQSLGFNISDAALEVFEAKSEEIGYGKSVVSVLQRQREDAENSAAIALARRDNRNVTFVAHDGCLVTVTPDGKIFHNMSDWY